MPSWCDESNSGPNDAVSEMSPSTDENGKKRDLDSGKPMTFEEER